jgi:serine protease Do
LIGLVAVGLGGVVSSGSFGSELRYTATVKLVQQAQGAIVNIHGQKTLTPADENYRRGETQNVNGMGTGVIIDERGYILTNHHVIEGVKKIEVTLSGDDRETLIATRVSHDTKTDLAIIKINAGRKLPTIAIGTSSDLMIGEPVVAIGNAYGYEHTVTRGIISQVHRAVQVSDSQNYHDLIQTDASINPGNSGGPLMNIDGEMIGINVAVRQNAQGIGFAIPVDMAMAAELMCVEHNTFHGIVAKQSAPARGKLVVGKVEADSPADKCGLQPGDVIVLVGDNAVARGLDVERALVGHQAGDEVEVTVDRDGETVKTELVLGSAPQRLTDRIWESLGLRLEPVAAPQLKSYQKQYRGGLLVTAVRSDSPAFRDGIRRGDILLGMHIFETISLENVNYVLKKPEFASTQGVKFLILRNDATYYGNLSVRR